MQVQALQGYFDKGVFHQLGNPIALPERQMVIVNILNIPVDVEIKNDIDFWRTFDKLAIDSNIEKLSTDDFPRTKFNREFITFNEEQKT